MLSDSGDAIHGSLQYAIDLFDAATLDRLGRHWATLQEAAVRHPDALINELPLMAEAERSELAAMCQGCRARYDGPDTLSALLSRAAERWGVLEAVRHRGNFLSYRDLHDAANRLAHYLHALGVGPESRIGVCLERSIDLVIALLAVLKAGAAYVPLEPDHPAERLRWLADDAQL